MTSLILRTTTRFMFPVLLLFSLFLLFRGHNDPGGGFAGGLVAASAFALYALAFGVDSTREALGVDSRALIGGGLLTAAASAWFALLRGEPLLTHQGAWAQFVIPGLGDVHLGTPLIFDLGVYLVVVGVTLTIVLPLAEE
jgi:multicomponent Na+:H+ antiporter subunit B